MWTSLTTLIHRQPASLLQHPGVVSALFGVMTTVRSGGGTAPTSMSPGISRRTIQWTARSLVEGHPWQAPLGASQDVAALVPVGRGVPEVRLPQGHLHSSSWSDDQVQ